MKNDFRKMQQIYEAHFYQDLDDDGKDQYYSGISESIQPFIKKCRDVAELVSEISEDVTSLLYSEEFKMIKELIENYTEYPEMEMKEFMIFFSQKVEGLDQISNNLAEEIEPFLKETLTGTKLR